VHSTPEFWPTCCGQMAAWIKVPLGMDVGLSPGHIVLMRTQLPLTKWYTTPTPRFRPVSVVAKRLDGSRCYLIGRWTSAQATLCYMGTQLSPKGAQPPIFRSCLLWPNGWMDEDTIWYAGRPWPRRHCVKWGFSSPRKGHSTPTFRPISIVAKWLDESRCHLIRR